MAPASLSRSSSAKWSKAPLSPSSRRKRYKESGLRSRHDWEHAWDLQRSEDVIDVAEKVDQSAILDTKRTRRKEAAAAWKKAELGDVPMPPKYGSSDFKKTVWWSLRGKLDVPKERRISYPGAEPDGDPSPLIGTPNGTPN